MSVTETARQTTSMQGLIRSVMSQVALAVLREILPVEPKSMFARRQTRLPMRTEPALPKSLVSIGCLKNRISGRHQGRFLGSYTTAPVVQKDV